MMDREYCMSSYLMYRMIVDGTKAFSEKLRPVLADADFERHPIRSSDDLAKALKCYVQEATADGKAVLALSGGIDSAILAKYMPKGSTAYTFRCIVPGIKVIDETPKAAEYAEECGIHHKIIEITWEDMKKYAPVLMEHKGAPIHSIEVQIYIAALKAREEGYDKVIFGENADIIYGGMDGLLSEDWLYGEFVDRYTYVKPYHVLRNPKLILEPFQEFCVDGHIDGHDFVNKYFRREALGTYTNACETAGVEFVGPYSKTKMAIPIDYRRVRGGDTKYLVREVYRKLYPNREETKKIPMPRPMNEWMSHWEGPVRDEFLPHCTDHMTGDQKWMVYALEMFLNMLEEKGIE